MKLLKTCIQHESHFCVKSLVYRRKCRLFYQERAIFLHWESVVWFARNGYGYRKKRGFLIINVKLKSEIAWLWTAHGSLALHVVARENRIECEEATIVLEWSSLREQETNVTRTGSKAKKICVCVYFFTALLHHNPMSMASPGPCLPAIFAHYTPNIWKWPLGWQLRCSCSFKQATNRHVISLWGSVGKLGIFPPQKSFILFSLIFVFPSEFQLWLIE